MVVGRRLVEGVRVGSHAGVAVCAGTINLLDGSASGSCVSAGRSVAVGFTGAVVGVAVGVPCAVVGGAVGAVVGSAEGTKVTVQNAVVDAKLGRLRKGLRRRASLTGMQPTHFPAAVIPLLDALVEAQTLKTMTETETWDHAVAFMAEHTDEVHGPQLVASAQAQACKVHMFTRLRSSYPLSPAEEVRGVVQRLVVDAYDGLLESVLIICGATPLRDWLTEIGSGFPDEMVDMSLELFDASLDLQWRRDRDAMARALKIHFPSGEPSDGLSRYFCLLESFQTRLPMLSFWKVWHILLHGSLPGQWEGRCFEDVSSPGFFDEFSMFLHRTTLSSCGLAMAGDTAQCEAASANGRIQEAIAQAKMRLAPSSAAPAEGVHILVEVLTATNLRSPQYRFGDVTHNLIGCHRELRPYVEVSNGSERSVTRVVTACGGSAKFGEALILTPENGCCELLNDVQLKVAVYDARKIQSLVRGDPLIGVGSLLLSEVNFGLPQFRKVDLMRRGRTSGAVLLRAGTAAPRSAYTVLASSSTQPLADVVRALAVVLVQPQGVDALLRCRPDGILPSDTESGDIALRRALQSWIVRLNRLAQGLSGLTEIVVSLRLTGLMRSAGQIVSACAATGTTAAEVRDLTARWFAGFPVIRDGNSATSLQAVDARLRHIIECAMNDRVTSACTAVSPEERLRRMGVALPEKVSQSVAFAVLARLLEAQETSEEEMFTGTTLVQNERVAPGLGAVLRFGRDGSVAHVFLYDLELIREWQSTKGWDPITSELLDEADIWPLSTSET
eukprot:TRINITY_DN69043_c0_g1_i1.p1 TRINITY_DN69043_c0_g1~~TRINITY_DN69043_c0_g1_i1.p1  ORF type:complete len:785 (-),score=108.91 TRINITY_DN69043_c0_g1_i1:68-2422(-)